MYSTNVQQNAFLRSGGFLHRALTDASAVVLNVENLLVPVQSRLATATISNLPASIEIDYVRVYQAVDDPKHMLG